MFLFFSVYLLFLVLCVLILPSNYKEEKSFSISHIAKIKIIHHSSCRRYFVRRRCRHNNTVQECELTRKQNKTKKEGVEK